MKFGFLSEHFVGVGAKYLTAVEVDQFRSNQHEFQGVGVFRQFLGAPAEKVRYPATFFWLSDEESAPQSVESFCTWSNVRRDRSDRSPEFHLYYGADSDPVVQRARAGDLLVVARTSNDRLLVLLSGADTTVAQQILWLFGLDLHAEAVDARELRQGENPRPGFAIRAILDNLGIEVAEPVPDAFDVLVQRFGLRFPPTSELSEFARAALPDVDPIARPDDAIVAWMDHEEVLFRYLEREIISERLRAGFVNSKDIDVDGFISFSLSVQNRRKSRAGLALAHHVEAILSAHGLRFSREAKTEKRNGPDFLFPGELEYHSAEFNVTLLSMLGVKTTCKDRWRQVLAEANKIENKHLFTLEAGISPVQTNEMIRERLQLVIPQSLFDSYTERQRSWLMNLAGFIELVRYRQKESPL